MLYREVGQFKTSYVKDMAIFPLREDRIGIAVMLVLAVVGMPLYAKISGSDFILTTVMIPLLVYALAAIGLNILTGYAGLVSLGTGAFMGVGAYACYKLTTIFPGEVDTPILEHRPQPVSAERRAKMLLPEDVADIVVAVARLPARAHVPELIIKPTTQAYF